MVVDGFNEVVQAESKHHIWPELRRYARSDADGNKD